MWLCVAGIMGGVIAGIISDKVASRRGPVAAILCLGVLGSIALFFVYQMPVIDLGSTTLAPAGARHRCLDVRHRSARHVVRHRQRTSAKNVGVAVGIIDGLCTWAPA